MRLTALSRAVGSTLARDLPAAGSTPIPVVRAGVVLTDRTVRALLARGLHAVWIEDELSAGIEPVELLPEHVRTEAAVEVSQLLDDARASIAAGQPLAAVALTGLGSVVDVITANIVASPDAALALHDLAAADQYTHRHSVNVCALGLLLARTAYDAQGWTDHRGRRRRDGLEERLAKLGLGLLLHDVGKMAIPADVLNKPGPLTDEEWALMRTHPDVGVELLRLDAFSPLVRSVVRDHHERWDGGGYNRGLAGTRISEFARIAAVADVYDAVTSERPYKAPMTSRDAVAVIAEGSATMFDPRLVGVFRGVIFPHPVGSEVAFEDGRVGVVSCVDTDRPYEPTVRVEGADGPADVRVDLRVGPVAAVG